MKLKDVWPRFGLFGGETARITVAVALTVASLPSCSLAQSEAQSLTPNQVDQVVDRLQAALHDYVFPDVMMKLQDEIKGHRAQYRAIADPAALADRLTTDMRAVGHDAHLQVTYGEELGIEKEPTPEERRHAEAFDLASGHGIRSARRFPGNVGYVDLAYFSPDEHAGEAIAAAMQVISGTDALILDLRRNGGGSGETETTLMSYFYEGQLSSAVRRMDGKTEERQHWTVPYVQGPRYMGKPIFILISLHTHSAAEVLAYDLKNAHRATLVGEHTSGDATSSTGTIDLGHRFSTFVPNGQIISPITHTNFIKTGVQPDVPIEPSEALLKAYALALNEAKLALDSDELKKEKAAAIQAPKAALLQEIDGFPKR